MDDSDLRARLDRIEALIKAESAKTRDQLREGLTETRSRLTDVERTQKITHAELRCFAARR